MADENNTSTETSTAANSNATTSNPTEEASTIPSDGEISNNNTTAATATTTGSSTNPKSKKRSRETATGTPAPLQSALQAIHTTLATSFPTNASLPAFQSLIHSYLTSKSNNVPSNLTQNLITQITTAASKSLVDVPPYVHLSVRDAAPQLNIDGTKLTVKGGMRGYRMVRASQGADSGCWYYEAVVLDPPKVSEVVDALPTNVRLGEGVREGLKRGLQLEQEKEESSNQDAKSESLGEEQEENKKKKRKVASKSNGVEQYSVGGHLRIGWSMRTGELQAPVGYDRWSYGIRDINGSRIHHSKREDKWGGVGFGPGDVVGFAICLVERDENSNTNADANDGHGSSGAGSNKRNQFVVNSNHIRFFKNGTPMGDFVVSRGVKSGGEAFDDIQSGTYYPAISSYMGGTCRVNFGPHFIYPPKGLPTGLKLRPMSEMCVKPMEPEKIISTFQKEKLLGKKVGEDIVKVINDAVALEAKMRYDSYQKHLDDNVESVRRARNERGAGISDLPDPIVPKDEGAKDVAMEE